ncbi:MAG: phytanoyl-CoA dioxygenase family protein [Chloroflexota bacterium]
MFQLSDDQLQHFREKGYLIIEDVLTDADMAQIRAEYEAILDREAPRLVAEGKLSQTYAELPFEERYTKILFELEDMYAIYQHLDISLPLLQDMPQDASLNAGPAVFNHLLTNPNILDISEAILGTSELFSNPVQHTRIKPPMAALPDSNVDSNVAKSGWHQDEAVLTADAEEINMLTVWVAMTNATVNNGCMMAVEGSHIKDVTMHCPGNHASSSAEIFIPDELIDENRVVPLEVSKGGLVLLHQRTEHGSYDNKSDQIRWSFDLRYQPVGEKSGREVFPGFVARSEANPEQVLTDPEAWAQEWFDTRDRIIAGEHVLFNERWLPFSRHQYCA